MFWYRTGTVTLVNGSDVANFVGATLTGEVKPGEILMVNGKLVEIERLMTATQVRLSVPWDEANVTGAPFAIIRNIVGASNFDLMKKIEEFLTDRQRSMDEFVDWMAGKYNEGPSSNGQFPMTDRYGVMVYAKSPDRLKYESDQLVSSLTTTLDSATTQLAALGNQTTWANQILGYKNDAAASATLASQWANNNENVAVTTGNYSAKHHAIKAAASQADVTTRQNDVIARQTTITNIQTDVTTKQTDVTAKQTDIITRQNDVIARQTDVTSKQASAAGSATTATTKASEASTSATNAAASATTSQKWAEENEDVIVTTGKYSAKHHAAKAAASATAAAGSATAAATSATNAATSKTGADTAKTGAETAKTGAESAKMLAETAKSGADAAKTAALAAQAAAEAARDEAVQAAGSVTGGLVDLGNVNLSSNTYPTKPTTYSSFWKVTVGGTVGGVDYGIGDTLVYSKTLDSWYKIDNTEAVTSVCGKSGVVTLVASDVGALSATGGNITGNLGLWNYSTAPGLQIGRDDGVANTPYIDFNSGGTAAVNYDTRIMASGGNGTVGNGTLTFYGASFVFNTGTIAGNGSGLTSLNASNLSSGTVPTARLDAKLQSLIGLTGAADKLPYFTGASSMAVADLAPFMRTRLADANLLAHRKALAAPVYLTSYRVADEFKHYYTGTSAPTGCLKITLPTLPAGTTKNTMIGIKARLYEYAARGITDITLGGYMSESAGVKLWYNTNKKVSSGVAPGSMREITDIKFGVEAGKYVILLGKTATMTDSTWSYPSLSLEKVVAQYSGAGDDAIWNDESLWTIELVTDISGVTINDAAVATLNEWHSGNFDPATKQNALGYSPVQQGTGVGQLGNAVKVGWSAGGLLLTVDSTDFANNWPISISKNAATATKLATARNINGVAFDGTADIVIADGSKLPLSGGTMTGNLVLRNAGGGNPIATIPTNSAGLEARGDANDAAVIGFHRAGVYAAYFGLDTDNKLKFGGWSAGANSWEVYHDGNAASKNVGSATKLATARAINGVNFDGTAAITIADSTKLPLAGGEMTGSITYDADNYGVGWGRGLFFYDGATNAGSMGAYGASGGAFTNVFMGVGTSPWTSGIGIRISSASGISTEGTLTSSGIIIGKSEVGGASPAYNTAQIRAESNGTNPAAISFHRPGSSACALVHKSAGLELHSTVYDVLSPMKASAFNATQDLNVTGPNAWITADSDSVGGNGVEQGAGISIGESGKKGSAAIHMTYTGDGYGHLGMGAVDGTSGIMANRAMAFFYTDNHTRMYGNLYNYAGLMYLGGGSESYIQKNGSHQLAIGNANGSITIGSLNGVFGHYSTTGTSGHYFYGNMTVEGAITAGSNITAYSDIKLKANLQIIPDALDKVDQLRGMTYDRIDLKDGKRHAGLIAQDVQKVLPEAVVANPDVDGDGETLAVNYNAVIGLLVEGMKELRAELAAVKAELAAVKGGVA